MRLDSTIQRLGTESAFQEKYQEHWDARKEKYREQNAATLEKTGKRPASKRSASRRSIEMKLRHDLIETPRDVACAHCGSEDRGLLDVAHIVPVALGGSDARENLMVLCTACHLKHDHMAYRPRARDPRNYIAQ